MTIDVTKSDGGIVSLKIFVKESEPHTTNLSRANVSCRNEMKYRLNVVSEKNKMKRSTRDQDPHVLWLVTVFELEEGKIPCRFLSLARA